MTKTITMNLQCPGGSPCLRCIDKKTSESCRPGIRRREGSHLSMESRCHVTVSEYLTCPKAAALILPSPKDKRNSVISQQRSSGPALRKFLRRIARCMHTGSTQICAWIRDSDSTSIVTTTKLGDEPVFKFRNGKLQQYFSTPQLIFKQQRQFTYRHK